MRHRDAARPLTRLRSPATVGLLAVLAAVAGCAAGPTDVDGFGLPLHRPVTQQELRAHRESHLLYPGSRVVRRVGSDEREQPGAEEPDPAFAGARAVAPVPAGALYRWYDRRLVALGYRRAAFYRTSDEVSGRAWTVPGGNEQVQVAVFAPGSAGTPGGTAKGGVAYQELLVDYRVTGPPPAPHR
jgi:hypothetical protein